MLTSPMLLALTSPALAGSGTLTLYKSGLVPVRAWVDGVAQGKIRKEKKATKLTLDAGPHEVWFSMDDGNVVTLCHGLAEVPEGGDVTVSFRPTMTGFSCAGLRAGFPDGPTAFKGAFVTFRVDSAVDAWVSIDSGPRMAFPDYPFRLNLSPGPHTIVLYRDVMDESVFDQGTVTLQPGQQLPVTCTTAGCLGFDAPAVYITEIYEMEHIELATPGVSIDFSLDVSASATDGATSSSFDFGLSVQVQGE